MAALVGYHTRIRNVESSAPESVLRTLTDIAAPLVSAPLSARVHPDVPSAAMSVLLQLNAAAEQLDQLVVNDLDHLLSGRDTLQHLLPYSTILYPSNERFSDLVIDVSLEKYATNLAHRLLDVGLRQLTLASKLLENAFELFGQLIEHGNPSRIRHSTDR